MARPKEIDETLFIIESFNLLLIDCNITAAVSKDLKELIVKGLGFPFFVMSTFPLIRKSSRTSTYFIPAYGMAIRLAFN